MMCSSHATIGKTVFASGFAPPGQNTTNPHNFAHTPGGSSSGSAAAVADYQVPFSVGNQTFGSVIRPGSFCGIYSFKPTWETVSHNGGLGLSKTLDTIGFFARSVDDFHLLAAPLRLQGDAPSGFHGVKGARFAWCKTAMWNKATSEATAMLAEATSLLEKHGAVIQELILPSDFDDAQKWHTSIATKEIAISMLSETLQGRAPGRADLDPLLTKLISTGEAQTWEDYHTALDGYAALRPKFDDLAKDFHAIITLSAPGEAPEGLNWTGDTAFNVMWTVCLRKAMSA